MVFCSISSSQISPGKLSQYHENLEGLSNCTKCHELGEEPTPEKCFSCHVAIKIRVDGNRGFHSSNEVRTSKCIDCHSEHNGREFELIHWKEGTDNFQHSLTGYKMEGKHLGLNCRSCHQRVFINQENLSPDETIDFSRTFLGLSSFCISCHVGEHGDQLTDSCINCHSYYGWKPAAKFNHNETQYTLTGKHRDLDCSKCHPFQSVRRLKDNRVDKKENRDRNMKFSGLEFQNCTPCHQDIHQGKFGGECDNCHTTGGFKTSKEGQFNHNLTDFPLYGKHKDVICTKCHVGGKMTDPLSYEKCTDCHFDYHRGQFTNRPDKGACETCHTVDGFVPVNYTIEMHQQSGFPLTGSHLAVPCDICHKKIMDSQGELYIQFNFPDLNCSGCHADIHQGQVDKWLSMSGCKFCHSTESWRDVRFDHNLSGFHLEGKHRDVACEKCHRTDENNLILIKPLKQKCFECHEDIHHGQFRISSKDKTECSRCHRSSGWQELIFDHNRDSRFRLEGAHLKLDCIKCHLPKTTTTGETFISYKPMGIECKVCHAGTENIDSLLIRQN